MNKFDIFILYFCFSYIIMNMIFNIIKRKR